MTYSDETFRCMGCDIRLMVDEGELPPEPRRFLEGFDRRLSRFHPDSDLSRLNADPRARVPASPLLCTAVSAGIWAAERTGGLVDPTLLPEIVAAGYEESREGAPYVDGRIDRQRKERRPARPNPAARWRSIRVGDGYIERPPGVGIDTGGFGKGLAADGAAELLRGRVRGFFVDCAGDIRIEGAREVVVEHPFTSEPAALFVAHGGVATSGIGRRMWQTPEGPAHHLLDPSTGEPAWTGVVQATALAPTALEAETLAKAALLSGPLGARRLLRAKGGLIVRDDGEVELIGPLKPRPVAMRLAA
jgi:thiamine biosynthesis lipoprotein